MNENTFVLINVTYGTLSTPTEIALGILLHALCDFETMAFHLLEKKPLGCYF